MPNAPQAKPVITTIELLRHGECEGGACYRGKLTDHALSNKGFQEMLRKLERLDGGWGCIVSSSLKRCASFASQLSASQNIALLLDDRLKEISFGQWDGELIEDVWRSDKCGVEAWFNDPVHSPPPEGEPADAFSTRVIDACEALLKDHAGEKLLIICHGGVMRVLLGHCLGVAYQCLGNFEIPYGCLSRIQVIDDGENKYYRLLNHNM